MKTTRRYVMALLAVSGALLIIYASPTAFAAGKRQAAQPTSIFASGPTDGGRLIITRSPILGDNVSISIFINGQVAGTLVRMRTFDRYITPGRHVIVAAPNVLGANWRGTVDIKAGKTYRLVASYNVNRLVLSKPGPTW